MNMLLRDCSSNNGIHVSKKNCIGQVKQARKILFITTAIGKRLTTILLQQKNIKGWNELLEK